MIARSYASLPAIIPFPALHNPDGPFPDGAKITLRDWYEKSVLPEIAEEQSRRSLSEDRIALNRWEELTTTEDCPEGNPDIREVTKAHLVSLRDGLLKRGCSQATVNKVWRELKPIFTDAHECGVIGAVPAISRRRKSGLLKITDPKVQRETLSPSEVDRLFHACRFATYPKLEQFPAPLLWRVAIVMFWTYGARTLDILTELEKSNIHWSDRLVKFQAMKTSKVQGLPLTDTVAAHLRSIWGRSDRVFPGFSTSGHWNGKTLRWKEGFYTTWRRDIAPNAGLPEVTFKHFRQAMVTRYNGIEPGLGSWIAGHFVPGVSAQSYDLPTTRIRLAIESAPVPKSFADVG